MQDGSRIKQKDGFTILEVAMAATVLAFAISTSIMVMQRGFASLDTARCLSYASQIMQSEFEKIRLTQWGNGTAAGTGTAGVSAYATTPTKIEFDASGFTSEGDIGSRMELWRTAADAPTYTAGMIQITLTIKWKTYDGRAMSRSYITYYGRNGLYDFISI